jgi:hypothetical protein
VSVQLANALKFETLRRCNTRLGSTQGSFGALDLFMIAALRECRVSRRETGKTEDAICSNPLSLGKFLVLDQDHHDSFGEGSLEDHQGDRDSEQFESLFGYRSWCRAEGKMSDREGEEHTGESIFLRY